MDKQALDRWITGNYGEDQFRDSEPDQNWGDLPADIPDWWEVEEVD